MGAMVLLVQMAEAGVEMVGAEEMAAVEEAMVEGGVVNCAYVRPYLCLNLGFY